MTRPVKKEMPRYLEIEGPLQNLIWEKYLGRPLSQEETRQVFQIDDAVLYHEFLALMDTRLGDEEPELLSRPDLTFGGFAKTEAAYLNCFHALSEAR